MNLASSSKVSPSIVSCLEMRTFHLNGVLGHLANRRVNRVSPPTGLSGNLWAGGAEIRGA